MCLRPNVPNFQMYEWLLESLHLYHEKTSGGDHLTIAGLNLVKSRITTL